MGHSPDRIRWVTEPEEIEARPTEFSVQRSGNLFTVTDPEGNIIRKRANIIAEIHKRYPEVPLEALNDAEISYYDYTAVVKP